MDKLGSVATIMKFGVIGVCVGGAGFIGYKIYKYFKENPLSLDFLKLPGLIPEAISPLALSEKLADVIIATLPPVITKEGVKKTLEESGFAESISEQLEEVILLPEDFEVVPEIDIPYVKVPIPEIEVKFTLDMPEDSPACFIESPIEVEIPTITEIVGIPKISDYPDILKDLWKIEVPTLIPH